MEIVIPAETGIGGSELSPDGRWAIWGSRDSNRLYIRDLITGDNINVTDAEWLGRDRRWLSGDRLLVNDRGNYWIVQLPELQAQKLVTVSEDLSLEQVQDLFAPYEDVVAYNGWSPSGSATGLIAFDADPPLVYSGGMTSDLAQQVTPVIYDEPFLDDLEQQYSPDGRFYTGKTNTMLADLYVYDAQTNEQVAFVKRDGRGAKVLGWSPDSRSVYFQFEVGGASGGILHPYEPLFKLTLDAAQDASTNEINSTWLGSSAGDSTIIQLNDSSND
ncbi:MAG: hypothetical protein KDE51_03095 [Anaerolineales bacterium]|nr:hypothetical protein [Anaerolineales bacterium]